MTIPATAPPPYSAAPLIQRLIQERGYPCVDASTADGFLIQHEYTVMFLPGDPRRISEAGDVAVVLPELCAAFEGIFKPCVAAPDAHPAFRELYGIKAWPALVFFRQGRYLGVIERMRDWDVYLKVISRLLEAAPTDPPGAARA